MEITWQSMLLAALGLGGSTVLTILITRLVNWLLDRRSQLVVEVRISDVIRSPKLANDLKEAIRSGKSWEVREQAPFTSLFHRYTKFFESENYIKLKLTNQTRKKITGLAVSLGGRVLMQVGEQGELVETSKETPAILGELQPGRAMDIHILAGSFFPKYTYQSLKEAIVFSSDEHVAVRYKFPPPDHIAFAQKLRRNAVLIILGPILILCITLSLPYLANALMHK